MIGTRLGNRSFDGLPFCLGGNGLYQMFYGCAARLRFEEVNAQGESFGFVKQVILCGKLSELLLMAA